MARREPPPLLRASKPGDLADVARRDLMVANGARQLVGLRAASFINWPLSGTLSAIDGIDVAPVMHGARPQYGKAPQNGAFL